MSASEFEWVGDYRTSEVWDGPPERAPLVAIEHSNGRHVVGISADRKALKATGEWAVTDTLVEADP